MKTQSYMFQGESVSRVDDIRYFNQFTMCMCTYIPTYVYKKCIRHVPITEIYACACVYVCVHLLATVHFSGLIIMAYRVPCNTQLTEAFNVCKLIAKNYLCQSGKLTLAYLCVPKCSLLQFELCTRMRIYLWRRCMYVHK